MHEVSVVSVTVPFVQVEDQPENALPLAAVAFSVTTVPIGNAALHDEPQEIPDGVLDTVPLPVPFFTIDSVAVGSFVNVAVHECATSIVTTPPAHAVSPPHPANVLSAAGVAVSETIVPVG